MKSTTGNAIVLVCDRLGSGFLGPYGNTWLETPTWNRLASESLLFESMILDSPALAPLYRSLWQGIPATFPPADTETQSLAQSVHAAGVRTALLTDSAEVAGLPSAQAFEERIMLRVQPPAAPAERIEDTQFAHLIAAALEWLAQAHGPFLLWIHAQAMQGPWDAPLALRKQFADDEDPEPDHCTLPPDELLDAARDPDRLLTLAHAYAGQVAVTDICLAPLLEAIAQPTLAGDTLLVTTSARGFPLGEHGRVGACGDDLYAEVLQVPLLIRTPDRTGATQRIHELTQPVDVHATLQSFFTQRPSAAAHAPGYDLLKPLAEVATGIEPRQLACSARGDQWSLRTPAWFFREACPPQLFAKPDDRFEVNEVADRCAEIVEELQRAMLQIKQLSRSGQAESLPKLSPALLSGTE